MKSAFDQEDLARIDEIHASGSRSIADARRQIEGLSVMLKETIDDMAGFIRLAHEAPTPERRQQMLKFVEEAQSLKNDLQDRIALLKSAIKRIQEVFTVLRT